MRWLIFPAALLAAHVRADWFKPYNDVAWPRSKRSVSMPKKDPEVMKMNWVDSLETVLANQKTREKLQTCVTMPKHYVKSHAYLFRDALEKNPSFGAAVDDLSFNPNPSASNFISLDAAIRGHSFTVIVTDEHSAPDETDSQPFLDETDGLFKFVTQAFRPTSDRLGRVATAQLIAAAKLGCSTLVVSYDTDFSKEHDRSYRQLIEKNNAPVERLVFSVPSEYKIGKGVDPVTATDQPVKCKTPERTHLTYDTIFRRFSVVETGRMRVFPESDQKRVFHQGGQMRRARSRTNWSAGKPAETNAGAARRTERGRTKGRTAVVLSPEAGKPADTNAGEVPLTEGGHKKHPPAASKPQQRGPPVAPKPKRQPPPVAPKPKRQPPPVAPKPKRQPPPVAPNAEQQRIPGVAGAVGSPQTGRQTRSRARQTPKETFV